MCSLCPLKASTGGSVLTLLPTVKGVRHEQTLHPRAHCQDWVAMVVVVGGKGEGVGKRVG